MFDRWYAGRLQAKLGRPYVHLLFGARQTGKSTLLNELLPSDSLRFNLADPHERAVLAVEGAHVGEGQACDLLHRALGSDLHFGESPELQALDFGQN